MWKEGAPDNYELYDQRNDPKEMVNLAASLSAMEVIDVKACSTWMARNSISPADLQPFIETVAYGPAEVERLLKEKNYLYF